MKRIVLIASLAGAFAACGGGSSADPDGAPAPDAPMADAGASCSSDAECNDGLFCNGEETCGAQGQCVGGVIVECNDDIACTQDLCSEEFRECIFVPRDADGDGRVDINCLDTEGQPLGDDCDDNDQNRFPGNTEVCDAENHDEDCDDTTFGIVDIDGDTFPDAACCNEAAGGGLNCGSDCDDLRDNVRPGVTEACDGLDNDCNGQVDEGVIQAGFADLDADGFGDDNSPMMACPGTARFATTGGDCADDDVTRNPGQLEICDGIDNNCNAFTELDAEEDGQTVTWYIDRDGDGFGSTDETVEACIPPPGYSLLDTDCNDDAQGINPAAAEACDGVDNDCNGLKDFQIGVNDFEDDDNDGLVDIQCAPLGVDCDDDNSAVGPGGAEVCDARDNDCDGNVDEGVIDTLWYRDNDGDQFGAVSSGTVVACEAPLGFVAQGGDCADADATRNPNGTESCNGLDDDCDTAVDNVNPLLLQDDPANCGTCGTTCDGANTTGTCNNGVCGCVGAFASCDADPSDCEVNTDNNSNHCGQCGNACSIENALSQCQTGTCEVSVCIPGFLDCDGNPDCETDGESDLNCGACGNDCTALANTSATCDRDECEVNACLNGFNNCNDDGNDGCESNPQTDPQNCGQCGLNCTQQNHEGSCTLGVCDCTPGFADCDGDPFNGCEVQLANDDRNCGTCNNDCTTQASGGFGFCVANNCEVSCDQGFTSCTPGDGDPLTCETQLGTLSNCASCGDTCTGSGGSPRCDNQGGTFACVTDCGPGFSDCDADPSTCESNTDTDVLNCGFCGNTCGAAGTCGGANPGQCDRVTSVTVGANFTCAAREGGGAACWGANGLGQLGQGNTTPSVPPLEVMGIPAVTNIAAGGETVCATTTGGLYCWGNNADGQLGTGAAGGSNSNPAQVSGITGAIIDVSVGTDHACAITNTGEVWCWGSDTQGQLGDGTAGGNGHAPQLVPGLPGSAERIQTGDQYTCAQMFGGNIWCWGKIDNGRLCDGAAIAAGSNPTPAQIDGPAGGAFSLSLGDGHGCLIRFLASEVLECWGKDSDLQVGNGAPAQDISARFTTSVLNPVEVHAGKAHTCARNNFGELFCFGDDSFAQMGQGATGGDQAAPIQVPGLTTVDRVATGATAEHECIVTNDGKVFCWGNNASGQCGVAAQATVNSPTEITAL